jgi:predicted site-specific integrase-resolvase
MLPVPVCRLGRLITVGEPLTGAVSDGGRVVVYVGVSSAVQRPDLDRQVARVAVWATGQKVVEPRGRFVRFGAEYVEAALTAQGRRLLVVDPAEVDDDPVRDVTEILTALCPRRYGRRAAADRARRAIDAATAQADPG